MVKNLIIDETRLTLAEGRATQSLFEKVDVWGHPTLCPFPFEEILGAEEFAFMRRADDAELSEVLVTPSSDDMQGYYRELLLAFRRAKRVPVLEYPLRGPLRVRESLEESRNQRNAHTNAAIYQFFLGDLAHARDQLMIAYRIQANQDSLCDNILKNAIRNMLCVYKNQSETIAITIVQRTTSNSLDLVIDESILKEDLSIERTARYSHAVCMSEIAAKGVRYDALLERRISIGVFLDTIRAFADENGSNIGARFAFALRYAKHSSREIDDLVHEIVDDGAKRHAGLQARNADSQDEILVLLNERGLIDPCASETFTREYGRTHLCADMFK